MENQAPSIDQRTLANAIRALSMDAIQAANSGHPGCPMGMADVATTLFTKVLKFDPARPDWPNRDRFVLSAGHGSMLLYSLLYLTGYEQPTLDDIKSFRQLGSPCAGHPEYHLLPGVETTTGPLGQGLATAVGMAIAEAHLRARHGTDLVDHYTYVVAGDGCLMEGISHEAIGLAGHLKLEKLIVLWDDNNITIDGALDLSSSDDQCKRFEAAGWHVQRVDGHDSAAVLEAINQAQLSDKPSMIACKTIIGFGAPNKQGTAATHGAPLGEDEITAARETLNWPYPAFEIPDDVLAAWRAAGGRHKPMADAWYELDGAKTLIDIHDPDMTGTIGDYINTLIAEPQKVATRKASQMALEVINGVYENTIGGSADLTGSNNTKTSQTAPLTADNYSGRYVYYGIREFGMAAAMNGMALHGGVVPYGGTFLVFSDYARSAMRSSALMSQRVIYVMTHDSIGLGEDGPTHQPVEHLASLRAMPNMAVLRPADVVETAECWQLAIENTSGPTTLALSRQSLPQVRLEDSSENLCARGGYVLRDADGAKTTLIATGSEVSIAVEAAEALNAGGISTRVVSMPSLGHFRAQPKDYQATTLGTGLRVVIEAASPLGWEGIAGENGIIMGITSFGESAPAADLYEHFGLTAKHIETTVKKALG